MKRSRVLVVDDNRIIAQTVSTLIRLLGHYCAYACDGRSAVGLAADYRPDVIFLDLKMPGLDGFGVARALREAGCEAKIVAMTGFGWSAFTEKPEDVGFDATLTKPATAGEIEALLSSNQLRWSVQPERKRA